MAKVKYIDPPNGWSYGFPKVIPEEITEEEVPEWLLKNGYPKAEIDNGGMRYRTWVEETDPAVRKVETEAIRKGHVVRSGLAKKKSLVIVEAPTEKPKAKRSRKAKVEAKVEADPTLEEALKQLAELTAMFQKLAA